MQFAMIKVTAISARAQNVRNIDDLNPESIKELAASIESTGGLLQPIVVEDLNDSGEYMLIFGQRRLAAYRLLDKPEIPGFIVHHTDGVDIERMQLIENVQREDLTPLEEAESYARLSKSGLLSFDTVSKVSGKTPRHVAQRMVLLNLIDGFKISLAHKKLSVEQAMMLGRLTTEQQERIGVYVRDILGYHGVLSTEDLKHHIEDEFHLQLAGAPFSKDDAELVPEAGPCTKCPKRTGNNLELFGDLGKKDTCTDKACFENKVEANFAQRERELKITKQPFVLITDSEYDRKKDVLTAKEWTPAKKTDKGAVPGLHLRERKRGKVEFVKPKRIPMLEEKKEGKKKKEKPAEQRDSYEVMQIKREEAEESSLKRWLPIMAAIIDMLKTPLRLTDGERALCMIELFSAKGRNGLASITANYGKIIHVPSGRLNGDQALKWVDNLKKLLGIQDDESLALLALVLDHSVNYMGIIPKEFFQYADRVGVDWKPIVQKVVDEEKAQAKAEKKKDSRKAPVKGVCRVCGCTVTTPCLVNGYCAWTDKTETLCDNPDCLKAAGSSGKKPVKKSAKKGKK